MKKKMSKSDPLSRRSFGAILAGAGAAIPALAAQQTPPQQVPAAAAQGAQRRRLVPDTPPFEAALE